MRRRLAGDWPSAECFDPPWLRQLRSAARWRGSDRRATIRSLPANSRRRPRPVGFAPIDPSPRLVRIFRRDDLVSEYRQSFLPEIPQGEVVLDDQYQTQIAVSRSPMKNLPIHR